MTYRVQTIQHSHCGVPVNTRVRDRDTVLEGLGAFGGHVLPASIDVRLDHDTGDVPIASAELLADVVHDLRLVVMVLLRVAI